MKSGLYQVKFNVDLIDFENEDDAKRAVAKQLKEMFENEDEFKEMELDLLEEIELDYVLEENETSELNFGL